jgi:hypothetical protein
MPIEPQKKKWKSPINLKNKKNTNPPKAERIKSRNRIGSLTKNKTKKTTREKQGNLVKRLQG